MQRADATQKALTALRPIDCMLIFIGAQLSNFTVHLAACSGLYKCYRSRPIHRIWLNYAIYYLPEELKGCLKIDSALISQESNLMGVPVCGRNFLLLTLFKNFENSEKRYYLPIIIVEKILCDSIA